MQMVEEGIYAPVPSGQEHIGTPGKEGRLNYFYTLIDKSPSRINRCR
jgi:hypothetical protein